MSVQTFFEAVATPVIFVTFVLFAGLMTSGTLFDNMIAYAAKYQKKLRDAKSDKSVPWIRRFSWRARSFWWLPLALVGGHALWQGFTCWWLWNDELPVTSGKVSAVFATLIANNLLIPFAALGFFSVALGQATSVAVTMELPVILQWGCVIALYFLGHHTNGTLQLPSAILLTFIMLWIRGTEYARAIKHRPILDKKGEDCGPRFKPRKCKN